MLLPLVVFSTTLVYALVALFLIVRYPKAQTLFSLPRQALTACFLLAATWLALTWLKFLRGELLIVWLLGVVWAADSGAYFGGRRFGRRKLAPRVSPGKTLEGACIGVAAATVVGMALPMVFPSALGSDFSIIAWVLGALAVALLSILGDLFVSLLKRRTGAKDAGGLLPGHGGIMDRLDSLIFTAPLVALVAALSL